VFAHIKIHLQGVDRPILQILEIPAFSSKALKILSAILEKAVEPPPRYKASWAAIESFEIRSRQAISAITAQAFSFEDNSSADGLRRMPLEAVAKSSTTSDAS